LHAYPNRLQPSDTTFEFINIREQCAWVHKDDPELATNRAATLIHVGVNSMAVYKTRQIPGVRKTRSALILGNSENIEVYSSSLEKFDIDVQVLMTLPDKIVRSNGHYSFTLNESDRQASVLICVPRDEEEASRITSMLDQAAFTPEFLDNDQSKIHLYSGVHFIPPGLDSQKTALALASRVAIWLNHHDKKYQPVSFVDPSRCRTCGTCVEVCDFGAPEIIQYKDLRTSAIDTSVCTGCGVCTAHCPSNAISTRFTTDSQIESMLDVILSQ
jgi:Na+-translocating ferredoxin:NAD+ oxidoreductase RNF subunit RnfB